MTCPDYRLENSPSAKRCNCGHRLRLRRTDRRLALAPPVMLPSAKSRAPGVLTATVRSSIPSPPVPLFTLRQIPRGTQRKTRGRAGRSPFLVRLLHSLPRAGLSRRTDFLFAFPTADQYTFNRLRSRTWTGWSPNCARCSNCSGGDLLPDRHGHAVRAWRPVAHLHGHRHPILGGNVNGQFDVYLHHAGHDPRGCARV